MEIMLLTLAAFALLMLAMAVGVIVDGRRLKGSCGGPGAADCLCEIEGRRDACKVPAEVARSKTIAKGLSLHE